MFPKVFDGSSTRCCSAVHSSAFLFKLHTKDIYKYVEVVASIFPKQSFYVTMLGETTGMT